MHQLTLRIPDDLADDLRRLAARDGRSVNALATAVLSALVDPDLEGDEASRLRARLDQAGLLAGQQTSSEVVRPSRRRVADARRRAATGKSLSEYVREGRG